MTPPQRTTLMAYWWPAACRAQGWDPDDRAFRLAKLSEIVGRRLASASDLNSKRDIDLVKDGLALLANPTVDNAIKDSNSEEAGQRRRYLHFIHTFPAKYIAGIIQDMPNGKELFGEIREPEEMKTIQLFQLVKRLEKAHRRGSVARVESDEVTETELQEPRDQEESPEILKVMTEESPF